MTLPTDDFDAEFDALGKLAADIGLERLVALASAPLDLTVDRPPKPRRLDPEGWRQFTDMLRPKQPRREPRILMSLLWQEKRAFLADGREVPWALAEAVEEIRRKHVQAAKPERPPRASLTIGRWRRPKT